jgi:hypothetical protein
MKRLFSTVAVILAAFTINAQESKSFELSAGSDIVSKYVWRGVNQGQGAAFQPTLGLSWKGLSLSAWGSTGFANPEAYEFDISLGYSIAGLSVALTDYYWDGHSSETPFTPDVDATGNLIEVRNPNYTSYGFYDKSHHLELSAAWSFGESLPLTLSVATMIGFNDPSLTEPDKNNYSTYINAGYDFTAGDVALTASVGVTPWGSALWGSGKDEFEFADISLKGSKELKITETFSLPVFAQGIISPATQSAHLVFGLSF